MPSDVTVTARVNYNSGISAILSDLSTELVPLVVELNGVAVITYTLTLSNYGEEPAGAFLPPDSAGPATGVLVGPGTTYVIGAGNYQVWVKYSGDPETVVMPATGWLQITGAPGGELPTSSGGDGSGAVDSVNGRTGAVTLTKADVGLSSVDNTSDASKNAATATLTNKTISGATNTLTAIPEAAVTSLVSDLAGKAAASHTHAEADVTSLTSDLAGKASTATQVIAGTGLTGGGTLAADRTLAVAYGTGSDTATQGNDSRVTGAAQKASNLSDLASASTARTNLGLATVAATGAYADLTGTVPTAALPPLAISETTVVASQAAMLALTAERGDVAVRSDTGKTYILASDSPTTLADWKEILATGQVSSVAGRTGVVVLTKSDVGLSSVDNTTDAGKPVSTAQQDALDLKADKATTITAGSGLTGGGDLSANRTVAASYGTPGASAVGDSAAAGSAATVAHSDHTHAREAFATAGSSAVGDSVSAGTAITVSHSDHRHGREAFGAVTAVTAFNTASANGTATTVSHSDHNHGLPAIAESDVTNLTSDLALKAPLASPVLTGTPTAPTASAADNSTKIATTAYVDAAAGGGITYGTPGSSAVADSVAAGSATTVARSDHRHGREAFATPGNSAVGDSAAAGSATTVAHSDHTHGREAFGSVVAATLGGSSANGSATTVSHSDHDHGLPVVVDVQTFTASGTWTAPSGSGYTTVQIFCIAGGGGGGSGRRDATSTLRYGGGGGAGGGFNEVTHIFSALGSSQTVTVGTGGAGGAAQTTNATSGNTGTAGGTSSVGTTPLFAYAAGGAAGGGGTGAAGTAGAAGSAQFAGSTGGSCGASGGNSSNNSSGGATGGGGGGPIDASNAALTTGAAGVALRSSSTGGVGGIVGGASPTTGYDATANDPLPGGGGGGGAPSVSSTAQAGANGGKYGGGGGGGSASLNGNNSGAGGNGANGIVVIISRK